METPNSRPIVGRKDLGNAMKKALISIITTPRRKFSNRFLLLIIAKIKTYYLLSPKIINIFVERL